MRRSLTRLFLFLFLFLLIVQPARSSEGAAYGLALWYQVVLPSLLPFLILSSLMQHYQKNLAKRPPQILFLGLLCGYPVGAKILADVSRHTSQTRPTASWMLTFCNQASPMFLFSYLPQMLSIPGGFSFPIFFGVYGSASLVALLSLLVYRPWRLTLNTTEAPSSPLTAPFIQVLETTMLTSFEIILKIGLYMMLFSILAYHLMALPLIAPLPQCLLLALNEMTTGIAFVSASPLSGHLRQSLAIAAAAFGGLSGFAQTCCVLRDSPLSPSHYLFWKFLQGLLAFVLVYLLT